MQVVPEAMFVAPFAQFPATELDGMLYAAAHGFGLQVCVPDHEPAVQVLEPDEL